MTTAIRLSDGSNVQVPDTLSEDALINYGTRANAALANGSELPPPPSGPTQTAAPPSSAPDASSPSIWDVAKSYAAPVGNMAANVAADIPTRVPDMAATIVNALAHTAENYGIARPSPSLVDTNGQVIPTGSLPLASANLKSALDIAPETSPWGQRLETALQIAATGGGGLASRLVQGGWNEAKGEAGGYLGGKAADAIDPRLREAFQVAGSIAGPGLPLEQGASLMLSPMRGANAGAIYDAARDVQEASGASKTPMTFGMASGPAGKQIEKGFGAIPIIGAGVENARNQVDTAVAGARDAAAGQVSPNPDVTPSGPGRQLLGGVTDYVNGLRDSAQQRMDQTETQLGQNTAGPAGGSSLVDVHPLLDALQGMKITTDAAGNVRPNVAPAIGSMINDEIANINSARTPEDPALHAQLQNRANTLAAAMSDPNTPQQQIPGIRAQLQQVGQAMDANLKVPFNVLRQMKTLQGYEVNGDGTPSLNSHMGGKVYDAYGRALGNFASGVDPQLGADYGQAVSDYGTAMDQQRQLKGAIRDPNNPGANEAALTGQLNYGLKGPASVARYAATPASVWNPAAASTLARLGQTPKDDFSPDLFTKQWGAATPEGRALYTQGAPGAADVLNNAATVAHAVNTAPAPVGMSKALMNAEVAKSLFERLGGRTLAAAPLGYTLESQPLVRAMAGRPTPWLQQLQQNLPAIMAVAQAQGRNQGY